MGRSQLKTAVRKKVFTKLLSACALSALIPGILHLANSAAIASRPETWADMVRPGAILYGYHPGYDPVERRAQAEKRIAASSGDEPPRPHHQYS